MRVFKYLAELFSGKDPVILPDGPLEIPEHEDQEISQYYINLLKRWRNGTLIPDTPYCSKDSIWADVKEDNKDVLRVYITLGISDRIRLSLRTSGEWNPEVQYDIFKTKMPALYTDFKLLFESIHGSTGSGGKVPPSKHIILTKLRGEV